MNYTRIFGLTCLLLVWWWGCDKEENFITDNNAKLSFSLDTLRFDTVFTEIGSATRYFKVFNPHKQPISISKISIERGANTFFRINVDGLPGNEATKVEIRAQDSIYVFVETTIDPDQPLSISPFIINDKILFETNGNQQVVHLEAWGQNANYFPSRFNKGVPVRLTCDNQEIVWDDPKPYVVYGEVFIDSCTLRLPPGTRIYVHGGVARNETFGVFNDGILYFLQEGRLRAQGTADNPVVIQGDRLEEPFLELDGQWNGIILGNGSRNNLIEYTTVKNARFGVLVDSSAQLTTRNSQYYSTSSSGLIGFHSSINAENCLIYNNGGNSVQLLFGGDYNFTYCTFASYGVDASATGMSNFFCYDEEQGLGQCQDLRQYRLNAKFINCILFGSRRDQLILSDISQGQSPALFNVQFQNCIVRVDELLKEQNGLYKDFLGKQCLSCINGNGQDKLFKNPNDDDYRLDSLSIAEGKAIPVDLPRPVFIDLEGKQRDTNNPDIGCYERGN